VDKDRLAGSARIAKGGVKVAVRKLLGDASLEVDGQAEKVEGKVQNAVGGAKDAIRDA